MNIYGVHTSPDGQYYTDLWSFLKKKTKVYHCILRAQKLEPLFADD